MCVIKLKLEKPNRENAELKKLFEQSIDNYFADFYEMMPSEITIGFSTRMERSAGICYRKKGKYLIRISKKFADKFPTDVMDVVTHELIHTLKGCMNHGEGTFKRVANHLNRTYETNVTVCHDKKIIENEEYKYLVKCTGCGQEIRRNRLSKVVKYADRYRCGICGKPLERVR